MKPDSEYHPRLWKCDCGLVLGYVYRDDNKIRHLAVFSHSCQEWLVSITGNTVFAPVLVLVTGLDAGFVRCSCGKTREWQIGLDALQELMDRKAARLFGLEKAER